MFIVYDKNMNKVDLPKGVLPLDIYIPSIRKKLNTGSVEGRSGTVDYGSSYESRSITLKVGLLAHDTKDYRLLRDKTYDLFNGLESFYISEQYQRGKRYKVKTIESFSPDRLTKTMAEVSISLEMPELPFAESIGTTQELNDGVSYDSELWGYGMGLIAEDLTYTHTGTSFQIYNVGNVAIHPFEQKLTINITGVSGTGFELKNETTGDIFKITDSVTATDRIKLDGPNITINEIQALRKTNRKFITLAPGWNQFSLNQSATVSFDFPFYYL